jgi:2-pyrone-4,6-dicarboxylate lactonase
MPTTLTYNPRPSAPHLRLPPGACDAHVHIFGPAAQFPFSETLNWTPADAPKGNSSRCTSTWASTAA